MRHMTSATPGEITQLLIAWHNGDREALDKRTPLVYDELRRIAKSRDNNGVIAMTERARYLRAKEIFLQAVGKDEGEREQYSAQACAGDDALRQDVLRLLRGDFQAHEAWEATLRAQVAEHLNTPQLTEIPPYPIGEKFGERYFIQKLLGQGGIGAV